ncbi:MAG: zinc ribbon domain-containing protein [Ardenticatenales bacterium]|nr:zinc ribbon domain-containing protein [Ardenticatenales bacterium]
MSELLSQLSRFLNIALFISTGFLIALWLSAVVWVFRDIRSRSRDVIAILLSVLLALVFPLLGVIIYMLVRPRETLNEQYERALEEEALLQEIEENAVCPACSEPVNDDFLLCPNCATRLRNRCPHCDRLTKLEWNVCPYCGS